MHDDLGVSIPIKATLSGSLAAGHANVSTVGQGLASGPILIARATSTMNPGSVSAELDLPRFIGELEDFRSLWESIGNNLLSLLRKESSVRDLLEKPVHALGNYLVKVGKTPSRLADTAVSAHLSYKLAIAPFLKDVNKLADMMGTLDKAYNRLSNPLPFIVHGTASDQTTTVSADTVITPYFKKRTTVSAVREVYTWAQCARSPIALTQWDLFKAAYGINPRIRVVWELVPLSFVVDWFVSIGKFLGQFDGQALVLPYTVLSSGASVKSTYTYSNVLVPLGGQTVFKIGLRADDVIRGTVIQKQYSRNAMVLPWNNSSIAPIQTRLPNFGQVGTLVELVYASLRR